METQHATREVSEAISVGIEIDPAKPRKVRVTRRQRRFLNAYVVCNRVSPAARQAKVARSRHYEWLKDAAYAAAFDQACQEIKARAQARRQRWLEEARQRRLARLPHE